MLCKDYFKIAYNSMIFHVLLLNIYVYLYVYIVNPCAMILLNYFRANANCGMIEFPGLFTQTRPPHIATQWVSPE